MKINFLFVLFIFTFNSCKNSHESCFSYSPAAIVPNQAVLFNASCSDNAAYYIWNFGDGNIDTSVTALTITHKFINAGKFKVILTTKFKSSKAWYKGSPSSDQILTVQ